MEKFLPYLLFLMLIRFNIVQAKMEGFIIGGEDTEISKYPHSAFLDARCNTSGHWICGAAILNQAILLTAAHCVSGCNWKTDNGSKFVAFFGHDDLKQVSIKRKVLDIRLHSDFNDLTMENDIAVAILRKDIPLGPNVQRVMITKEYPDNTTQGFVAGWGIVREDLELSSMTLKHVRQKLRSVETCALIGHLHEGMFCAGSTEKGHEHPAKGDSGSALVTPLGFHQIGLVSFCIRRYPALMVYTNVSYYYDWIDIHAQEVYCENLK